MHDLPCARWQNAYEQKYLPMHGKQKPRIRRKKHKRQKRLSAGISIDCHPAEIEERTTFSHWEMDTVYLFPKARLKPLLLVLTERITGQEIIMRIRSCTPARVVRALSASMPTTD